MPLQVGTKRQKGMARLTLLLALLCCFALALPQRATSKTKAPTISTNSVAGLVLYLSDGTTWEIRHEDRARAANWPKGEAIGVYKTSADRDFPYRLILKPGRNDCDIVSAKRLLREK